MSYENPRHTQDAIDNDATQRTLHDADLIKKGARYIVGQFVITDKQYRDMHAVMTRDMNTRTGELMLQNALEMDPEAYDKLLAQNLSAVLAHRANKKEFEYKYDEEKKSGEYVLVSDTTPSLAEDMGLPDGEGEHYVEFVPVGEHVRRNPLYRHAVTMSQDGKYVGISKKQVTGDIDQSSRKSDEAIIDLQLTPSRDTHRYSGSFRRGGNYGSREATQEEKTVILNLLYRLSADDGTVRTKIGSRTRAVYRRGNGQ